MQENLVLNLTRRLDTNFERPHIGEPAVPFPPNPEKIRERIFEQLRVNDVSLDDCQGMVFLVELCLQAFFVQKALKGDSRFKNAIVRYAQQDCMSEDVWTWNPHFEFTVTE